MLDRLPKFIDPLLLADKNVSLEGKLPLSSLDRVSELLANDDGDVILTLHFGKEGKLAKIEGRIKAVLSVKCQRCLEPVEWPIDSEIKLGIVKSFDQAGHLPESFEPLLVSDEDKIPLKDIVEDEILILLPDTPKHSEDCAIAIPSKERAAPSLPANRSTTNNPFSILVNLKKPETFNGSTKK
ncbi:MAG: DUF177 domain-containing protein [Methylococcaceae bacterium]|nr:DUF177 domain-containing protein [Methylococcaceae bacterium]